MRAIVLRYHTLDHPDGNTVTIAEATDLDTGDSVASYSLRMIAAWLKRYGYRWRVGSSGIWEQAA